MHAHTHTTVLSPHTLVRRSSRTRLKGNVSRLLIRLLMNNNNNKRHRRINGAPYSIMRAQVRWWGDTCGCSTPSRSGPWCTSHEPLRSVGACSRPTWPCLQTGFEQDSQTSATAWTIRWLEPWCRRTCLQQRNQSA